MNETNAPTKTTIFKIFYLVFTLLVAAFAAYQTILNIVHVSDNHQSFDDIILLVAAICSVLFEGGIAAFIIRSFKAPTLLLKFVVFKDDGTPYISRIIIVSVVAFVALATSVVMFVSAYVTRFINLETIAQSFLLDLALIIFVNAIFAIGYFFAYRDDAEIMTEI